jgi:hypothetical protein
MGGAKKKMVRSSCGESRGRQGCKALKLRETRNSPSFSALHFEELARETLQERAAAKMGVSSVPGVSQRGLQPSAADSQLWE